MPQFFLDKQLSKGVSVEIRGGDARHISQVLRLKAQDWLVLSDGQGRSFRAIIDSASPAKVKATIVEQVKRRVSAEAPVLALALIKGDRFEWAIQKAVELGCKRMIPFRSSRTVPQYASAASVNKIERWQKIALAAAKQSGLPFKPVIECTLDYETLCDGFKNFNSAVLFYEGECENDIKHVWEKHKSGLDILIIGPEGGFTGEEIECAKKAGAITASLGTQILRVETAAITALSIWQYELGNMDVC